MNRMAPPSFRYGRGPFGHGTMWPTPPKLFALTKMYPKSGSKETPPQSPPPMLPGIRSEEVRPNGVKGPSWRNLLNQSLQNFSDSGVRFISSSLFSDVRANGTGFTGNGSVGEYHSPGTSPLGIGRSSTPKTGLPLLRSKMKSRPCLVI